MRYNPLMLLVPTQASGRDTSNRKGVFGVYGHYTITIVYNFLGFYLKTMSPYMR